MICCCHSLCIVHLHICRQRMRPRRPSIRIRQLIPGAANVLCWLAGCRLLLWQRRLSRATSDGNVRRDGPDAVALVMPIGALMPAMVSMSMTLTWLLAMVHRWVVDGRSIVPRIVPVVLATRTCAGICRRDGRTRCHQARSRRHLSTLVCPPSAKLLPPLFRKIATVVASSRPNLVAGADEGMNG